MTSTRTLAGLGATVAAALLLGLSAAPARAADVGISIGISQPGVYGRIDIGRFPNPVVVVPQPVIIAAPPPPPVYQQPGRVVAVAPAQPVYLWVPPGHQKNWRKHCGRYNACGVPVYFVKDEWYHQHVHQGHGRCHGKGHGHGHGKHKD